MEKLKRIPNRINNMANSTYPSSRIKNYQLLANLILLLFLLTFLPNLALF